MFLNRRRKERLANEKPLEEITRVEMEEELSTAKMKMWIFWPIGIVLWPFLVIAILNTMKYTTISKVLKDMPETKASKKLKLDKENRDNKHRNIGILSLVFSIIGGVFSIVSIVLYFATLKKSEDKRARVLGTVSLIIGILQFLLILYSFN